MNHLQAGVEFSFAVFPDSSVFSQPCEGTLDYQSLGHDGIGVEFAAFGDLHGCPELVLDRVGEGPAHVAHIGQHPSDMLKVVRTAIKGGQ